ncbi:DUF2335 domain-containing protein [Streptomyces bacillaris]|uniref:DUF2335 domain-containing protein n=2 Tax=Streptomyces bacillaris TaxID=68179 RepID=UPI0034613132
MRREIVRRHVGPLPSPHMLAEYEAVLPGLAERIVSMAEGEQAHRHELEKTDLRQDYIISRTGQVLGITALLVIAALAAYLGYLGHPGWAVAVAGIDIAAVVGVFVTGQFRITESDQEPVEDTEDEGDPGQTVEAERRREIGHRSSGRPDEQNESDEP